MQIPCGKNPAFTAPNFNQILHNSRVSQNSAFTPNPASRRGETPYLGVIFGRQIKFVKPFLKLLLLKSGNGVP